MSTIFDKKDTLKKIEKLGVGIKHDIIVHHDKVNEIIDMVNLLIDERDILIKEIEQIKTISRERSTEYCDSFKENE